jgi:integrase
MYQGVECRETLKMAHSKANIRFAERLRGEILNAIEMRTFSYIKYFPDSPQLKRLGLAPARNNVTIGELLEDQFKQYKKTLALSSLKTYDRSYRINLLPKWGNTLVRDLTPAALREWLASSDMKARSIRQILIPLRSALEQAVNDDLIESNPMDRVMLKKILDRDAYKVKFVTDPFDAKEISSILAACSGQERNLWKFAFATGMRPSEYIALRWESVDWTACTVAVVRARVAGEFKEEAKTRSGMRLIDLRNGAIEALKEQMQYTALANDLVFHNPLLGRGWYSTAPLSKRWRAILEAAAVRHRNPYQTRHTFASTLLSTGENAMYVAKQMGHTDTTMVTRTYGRWIEQDDGVLPHFYQRALPGKRSKSM